MVDPKFPTVLAPPAVIFDSPPRRRHYSPWMDRTRSRGTRGHAPIEDDGQAPTGGGMMREGLRRNRRPRAMVGTRCLGIQGTLKDNHHWLECHTPQTASRKAKTNRDKKRYLVSAIVKKHRPLLDAVFDGNGNNFLISKMQCARRTKHLRVIVKRLPFSRFLLPSCRVHLPALRQNPLQVMYCWSFAVRLKEISCLSP